MQRNPRVSIAAEPSGGLLVSMCMRQDHGFLAATPLPDGSLRPWLDEDERRKRIAAAREFHRLASTAYGEVVEDGRVSIPRTLPAAAKQSFGRLVGDAVTAGQVWEEMAGQGFWSPENDARYALHMPSVVPQGGIETLSDCPCGQP